ncbi:hypothetical protein BH24ACT14_BH24ACT14_05050 [soil metagenome]|jgi:hypothetical protein
MAGKGPGFRRDELQLSGSTGTVGLRVGGDHAPLRRAYGLPSEVDTGDQLDVDFGPSHRTPNQSGGSWP